MRTTGGRTCLATLVLWQSRQLKAQAPMSLFTPGLKNLDASRGREPDTRMRKGVKRIKGSAAELRRKKWSIHAGRSEAEENMTDGEGYLDDLETGVSGQCHRCGTCRLRGGECLGVEERRHVGWGEARKLRRKRERVSGGVVNSRDVSNILS